jgi:hypothetical protein
MQIRLVALAVVSGMILSCSSSSEKPVDRPPDSQPTSTAREQLVGKWDNMDTCLVRYAEFRADGVARYTLGGGQLLEGTWRFTDEAKGTLELTPQPLFVYPKPLPRGEIQVAFQGNELVINGDGPATRTKPLGGRFSRIR